MRITLDIAPSLLTATFARDGREPLSFRLVRNASGVWYGAAKAGGRDVPGTLPGLLGTDEALAHEVLRGLWAVGLKALEDGRE